MISRFNLINIRKIMEVDNQIVLGVKLEIEDELYISIAKNILKDNNYYKDGWEVEVNIDKKTMQPIGIYELFYIGDEGRVYIENLISNRYNNGIIASLNVFILKYLYNKNMIQKKIKEIRGKIYTCIVGNKAVIDDVIIENSLKKEELVTSNVKNISMIWENKIYFETENSFYIVNQN